MEAEKGKEGKHMISLRYAVRFHYGLWLFLFAAMVAVRFGLV